MTVKKYTTSRVSIRPREKPASRASNAGDVRKNTDGSTDIYFGPKAPKGQESNWVPTDPERRFELMFRAYAPTKAFFDKKWRLSDAERIG